MIADIFYPIFNLTITILVCFIRKKRNRKCNYNVISGYNRMIVDIFYPIFALTTTILVCFIKKKSKIVQGICTYVFTKASPCTPWGAYSSLQNPNSKNRCAHIFSLLSPGTSKKSCKK